MKKKPAPPRRRAPTTRGVAKARPRGISPASAKTPDRPTSRKIETILVPIDFSSASLYPIAWAKFIARQTNATIQLVHVHELGYPVPMGLTPPIVGSETEIKEHLHRDLQAVAISQGLLGASFHIRAGRAFDQICQLASEIRADLIVLATHGRTGWERVLLGSTAERVVRHTPAPVLVTRPRRSARKREIKLRRIAVPVDFSPCAAQGLGYAIGLAQSFDARLALLNVVQFHHDLPPTVIYSQTRLNRWGREVAQAHMVELLRETDFGRVKQESAIKKGAPAQTISRYAQKIGADLIVTSTHGRTGLSHILIGSIAEQIVRYATLPVLVVPTRSYP